MPILKLLYLMGPRANNEPYIFIYNQLLWLCVYIFLLEENYTFTHS